MVTSALEAGNRTHRGPGRAHLLEQSLNRQQDDATLADATMTKIGELMSFTGEEKTGSRKAVSISSSRSFWFLLTQRT